MITCIAIDDEPLALRQLVGFIEKVPYLKLLGQFSSAIEALDFLRKKPVDLMFVDINMPDLSGMDFVRSLSPVPRVIFVTAYREYAVEAFRVDAADYLVKPISFADFLKAVEKARQRFFSDREQVEKLHHNEQFLFIKYEYKIIRIDLNNIRYIESMGDYVKIHLIRGKPIMALLTMKKLMEHLPKKQFMRVHKSYIVNLNQIRAIVRNAIILDNDFYISISEHYRKDLQRFLDENFLK